MSGHLVLLNISFVLLNDDIVEFFNSYLFQRFFLQFFRAPLVSFMNQNMSDEIKHQGFVIHCLFFLCFFCQNQKQYFPFYSHQIFPIIALYSLFVYQSNRIFQSGVLGAPKILLSIKKVDIDIEHLTLFCSSNMIINQHPITKPPGGGNE